MAVLMGIFWIAFAAMIWTYIGYPTLLILLNPPRKRMPRLADFHPIGILIAAHNEAPVIEQKIHSIYKGNYPIGKLQVFVGSDKSTDETDEIVLELAKTYPNLHLIRMDKRTGKSGIINHLSELCDAPYLLITDANIFFEEDILPRMMEHMADDRVHLVGGNIIYRNMTRDGIAREEGMYLGFENRLKQRESDLWNIAMGIEGGCMLIRKSAYVPISPTTIVEDFHITMNVIKTGGWVRFVENAKCTENVSVLASEEFRRKVRISTGNFQNLRRFFPLTLKPFHPVGFAFISHKVLRWLTPLFLLICLITSAFLYPIPLFRIALFSQLFLLLIFALDRSIGVDKPRPGIIRFVGHFYLMNFALLIGLVKYLQGVKNNVWQPTKRN